MQVAAIQFSSGPDLERNLKSMEQRLGDAIAGGARLVVFPEHAYLYAERPIWHASLPRFAELRALFASWAKRHGIFLIPGSLREPVPGKADRFFNTLPLFGPDGSQLACYRKIFLFRAKLSDRDYNEGEDCQAGVELVTAKVDQHQVGLSICYDLRFPELFRGLKKRGASLIVLPSAFTVPTGKAHWDCLTRARAIENQVFLVAPGQVGVLGNGAATFGHSRIISPWGEVLAEVSDGEGIAMAQLDLGLIEAARGRVDAWASRRDDLFPIA